MAEPLFSRPLRPGENRLPPSATLTVGLTWLDAFGIDRLQGRLFAYNAFNGRYYQPDIFQSYEPRLEMLPNPWPDFRFVSSLTYSY